ncbi:HET-domain-containing protein [Ophiobolus disseminans]|uniref:HET-domain-containing protein n=1 Tax=Ophiobolus disseminans TaxID=1469910 RepID=A0A6A6ZQD4_9PLEO|nr:HET-domain-containing protein [Ophiobolus disseminans]
MDLRTDISLFTYTALAPDEIRLLEPTGAADGLSWSLRTVNLDDNLEYDALSYVWGTQTGDMPIICNEQSLLVHHNLYLALPFVANRYRGARHCPIWIDAVCINQRDENEKLVQIGMMNRIYRDADTVWVWLGIAANQARVAQAIALLPKYVEASRQMRQHHRQYRLDDSLGLNRLDADLWSAIFHIVCNPWFYRVWVVQEAVLAKSLRFLCGEQEIDFQLLSKAIKNSLDGA